MPRAKLPDKDFTWTPELAYAVGLLVTDGNLSKDGRHITMRSAEKELLNVFKQCLNIKTKIGATDNQRGFRVQFGNAQFYRWLLKIGLFPAKTYTIGALDIPDNFFRDFLRGCIDGDGNIRTYLDSFNTYKGRRYNTQRLFIRIVSASEQFISWLQHKTSLLSGINGVIIKNKPASEKHVPTWVLQFAKNNSLHLVDWIYYQPNIPHLKRKRKIAEKAISIISKQKRREYSRINN